MQGAEDTCDLARGTVVDGNYRIEGLLGRGGMGAVYKASVLATGVRVALKVVSIALTDMVDVVRFQRESEIAARLGAEAGFVQVHVSGQHAGCLYYVMDLVEGPDLRTVLAEGITPERLATVVARAARSLHTCHEAGIVHRDLKPGNILLAPNDQPKIVDLGIARDRDRESLTRTGEILGTPDFVAPEQVEDSRSVDRRTDVYSLGATLYTGLTGAPPFSGGLIQVLDQVVHSDPPPIRSLAPDVPSDLVAICAHAMAKQADDRYPTAALLADDLERFVRGESVSVVEESTGRRFLRRVARRDSRAVAQALAALVAVGVIPLAVMGTRHFDALKTLAETTDWDGATLVPWEFGQSEGAPPERTTLEKQLQGLEQAEGRLLTEAPRARCRLLAAR